MPALPRRLVKHSGVCNESPQVRRRIGAVDRAAGFPLAFQERLSTLHACDRMKGGGRESRIAGTLAWGATLFGRKWGQQPGAYSAGQRPDRPGGRRVLGCAVAQIAKSIVFRGKTSDRPVLVIACGDNRVSEKKVAALIGEKIGRADAEFVRTRTGFAIGGVAPFAHKEPPLVVVDAMVRRFLHMWAAGGTPETMFPIATTDLIRLAGGPLADIAA